MLILLDALANEYGGVPDREELERLLLAVARGGTVIKARWTGVEDLEQSYGLTLQREREIVAIVVPNGIRNAVMEAVNAEHGLKSDSQAMLCSMGVEQIVRL